MNYYLLVIWQDVEPELRGPFLTSSVRDATARQIRADEGDAHGLYRLDVLDNQAVVEAYAGGFFKETTDGK